MAAAPKVYSVTATNSAGQSPVSSSYTLPNPMSFPNAYVATSAGSWVLGDDNGVMLDGASLGGNLRYLTLGRSFIAAGTGYIGVATASGQLFYFDAKTDQLLGTLNLQGPSGDSPIQLSMSSDGSVVAAALGPLWEEYGGDYPPTPPTNVNIYSLSSGTLINSFSIPDTATQSSMFQMSLSGAGTVLTTTPSSSTQGCYAEAVDVTGGAPIWCEHRHLRHQHCDDDDGERLSRGMLDNARLVAEQFGNPPGSLGSENPIYEGASIYSSSGANLGSAAIPEITSFQLVSGNTVYSPRTNTTFPVTTGIPSWVSGDAYALGTDVVATPVVTTGAVTGSQVIFSVGALLLAQPY